MYPIQVTLSVGSQEQLQSILEVINNKSATVAAVKMKPTAEPVAVVDAPVVHVEEVQPPVETAPEAPVALPYQTVQAAFRSYINNKGRDAAAAVLASFNLTTLKDASPEQLIKIHAKVKA